MPGLSPAAGSQRSLNAIEEADELGAVHLRQQFGAGLAVAVLAGERAAVRDDQLAQVVGEFPEAADAGAAVSRSKSMRTWMQPSPKWP